MLGFGSKQTDSSESDESVKVEGLRAPITCFQGSL